jgi:hypothetical protein
LKFLEIPLLGILPKSPVPVSPVSPVFSGLVQKYRFLWQIDFVKFREISIAGTGKKQENR